MCMFIGNLKITCLSTGNQIQIYLVSVKPQHNYIAQSLSTKQRNTTRRRISASGCTFEEILLN